MRRRIFIKQMTPAEAGDTKTHEKYIRLPNNFDYQSFFQQEGITNGSVIPVLGITPTATAIFIKL